MRENCHAITHNDDVTDSRICDLCFDLLDTIRDSRMRIRWGIFRIRHPILVLLLAVDPIHSDRNVCSWHSEARAHRDV
jgi:hypothetical protein